MIKRLSRKVDMDNSHPCCESEFSIPRVKRPLLTNVLIWSPFALLVTD